MVVAHGPWLMVHGSSTQTQRDTKEMKQYFQVKSRGSEIYIGIGNGIGIKIWKWSANGPWYLTQAQKTIKSTNAWDNCLSFCSVLKHCAVPEGKPDKVLAESP